MAVDGDVLVKPIIENFQVLSSNLAHQNGPYEEHYMQTYKKKYLPQHEKCGRILISKPRPSISS